MADDSGVWAKIVPTDFNLGGGKVLGIHVAGANTDQSVNVADVTPLPGMFIRYTPESETSILLVHFTFTAFVHSNNGKENAMAEFFLREEFTGVTVWSGALNSENAQSNASRPVIIRSPLSIQVDHKMNSVKQGNELTYQMCARLPSVDQTSYVKAQNASYGCRMTVMEVEK